MDLYLKQRANEYKKQLALSSQYGADAEEREELSKKLVRVASMAHAVQRHPQSFMGARYSTDSTRLPADHQETSQDAEGTQSPGPGSYLDIYKGSSFKPKTGEDRLQDLLKHQEFGSQTQRFDGPEERSRARTKHLGPGCYQSQLESLSRLKVKSALLGKGELNEAPGFGSQLKSNRHAYITENQATRMRTPGKYSYSDNRRTKRSHNKAFNEYTTNAKRAPFASRDDVPGPGAYDEE